MTRSDNICHEKLRAIRRGISLAILLCELIVCGACRDQLERSSEQIQPTGEITAGIPPATTDTSDSDTSLLAGSLPEAVGEMSRSALVGDSLGFATAKALYKDADGGLLDITISEITRPSELLVIAGADWVATQFERETTDKYARAFQRHGSPVFEMYSRSLRHGQIKTLFDKRWLVEITGYGVAPIVLREALLGINTARFRNLPAQPISAASHPPEAAVRPDHNVPAPPPLPAPASHTPGSDRADTKPPR